MPDRRPERRRLTLVASIVMARSERSGTAVADRSRRRPPTNLRSRTDALAAVAKILYDRTPSPDLDERVVSSVPRLVPGLPDRHRVDVFVSPPKTPIGIEAGLQAETYDVAGIDGVSSHAPYLQLIINLLFGKGRGDGVAVATGTTRPNLLTTLDRVCGPRRHRLDCSCYQTRRSPGRH